MRTCDKCKQVHISIETGFKYHNIFRCNNCDYWTYERIEECCRDPFKIVVIDRKDHELFFIREQCRNCGGCINKSKPLSAKIYGDKIRGEYDKHQDKEYYDNLEDEKKYLREDKNSYRFYNSNYYKYTVYLTSEVWKAKRKVVLERDANLCQVCKQTSAEEVHHLTYDRIYNEHIEDLLSVCSSCHKEIHLSPLAPTVSGNIKSTCTTS